MFVLTKIPLIIPIAGDNDDNFIKFKYAEMYNITQKNVTFLFLLDYDTIFGK